MAIKGVDTKCYILALFVRDDGERFLLGSGHYEFKDTQMHFAANAIQNDIVEVQGNDGFLLAGQVRRPGTQSFDGYVGDGTMGKEETESYRRQFFSFFRKNFFYKVIYVFSDGTAIQRKSGFLVDDPTVEELYQMYPEYHVALNFEDVNYYSYSEDEEGQEQYAKEATIDTSSMRATGGLVWDNLGVVWEDTQWGGEQTASGTEMTIENEMSVPSRVDDIRLDGDTEQQTYSGANLYNYADINETIGAGITTDNDGWITCTVDNSAGTSTSYRNYYTKPLALSPSTQYVLVLEVLSVSGTGSIEGGGGSSSSQVAYYGMSFAKMTSGSKYILPITSKSDITGANGLRTYFRFNAGQSGSITVRFSVLADTSVTPETFVYQPYTGGIPAPNPDYPQDIQTVTGEQTVEVHGKNLFYGANITSGGITSVWQGSSLTISGTASATWANITAVLERPLPAGTYTFSIDEPTSLFRPNMRINYDGSNHDIRIAKNTSSVTFTVPDGAMIRLCHIDQLASGTILSGTYRFQLEEGSTATAYQPYQSQSYEVNLGKNLFDKSNANILASYFDSSTTTITADSRNRTIFIPCSSNTTYTVSKLASPSPRSIGYTEVIPANGVQVYGITNIARGGTTGTITTGASAKYLVVRLWSSSQDTSTTLEQILESVQIEAGSTATSYAPYFTPIELCKIGDYQDYIYKSGDDWYVHKATGSILLTGDNITRVYYGCSQVPKNPSLVSFSLPKAGVNFYTNNFIPSPVSLESPSTTTGAYSGDSYLNFRYGPDAANLQEAQDWFNAHNTTLYAPLATPTDTKITDATLIGQLEALGAMRLFVGENNLSVEATGTNLPAPLSFKYYTTVAMTGAEWEEGGSGGATVVEVDSITNTYPIWRVKGPAVDPQLSVINTNTTIRYTGTVTSTQTLEIDMFNKTAKLNGVSVIGNVSGDWVSLAPGTNRVIYTAENADAQPSTIEWQEVVG